MLPAAGSALFVGNPGTGKTSLIHALIHGMGLPPTADSTPKGKVTPDSSNLIHCERSRDQVSFSIRALDPSPAAPPTTASASTKASQSARSPSTSSLNSNQKNDPYLEAVRHSVQAFRPPLVLLNVFAPDLAQQLGDPALSASASVGTNAPESTSTPSGGACPVKVLQQQEDKTWKDKQADEFTVADWVGFVTAAGQSQPSDCTRIEKGKDEDQGKQPATNPEPYQPYFITLLNGCDRFDVEIDDEVREWLEKGQYWSSDDDEDEDETNSPSNDRRTAPITARSPSGATTSPKTNHPTQHHHHTTQDQDREGLGLEEAYQSSSSLPALHQHHLHPAPANPNPNPFAPTAKHFPATRSGHLAQFSAEVKNFGARRRWQSILEEGGGGLIRHIRVERAVDVLKEALFRALPSGTVPIVVPTSARDYSGVRYDPVLTTNPAAWANLTVLEVVTKFFFWHLSETTVADWSAVVDQGLDDDKGEEKVGGCDEQTEQGQQKGVRGSVASSTVCVASAVDSAAVAPTSAASKSIAASTPDDSRSAAGGVVGKGQGQQKQQRDEFYVLQWDDIHPLDPDATTGESQVITPVDTTPVSLSTGHFTAISRFLLIGDVSECTIEPGTVGVRVPHGQGPSG